MNRLTALTAAALAAAIGTAPVASASTIPVCRPSQLHVSLRHEQAMMGHTQFTIAAKNTGPACILSGYPRLGLAGKYRERLFSVTEDTRQTWFGPGPRPGHVLVLFGLAATATVTFASVGEAASVPARYLTVNGDAARFPGIAWVYLGQLQATAWR